jgi:hypothetical protein
MGALIIANLEVSRFKVLIVEEMQDIDVACKTIEAAVCMLPHEGNMGE